MKKFLITVLVALLLLLGVVLVVPGLVDLNHYKEPISRKIAEYTGRSLNIKGDIRLSFLPTIVLKVENVSLSNAPGFSFPEMVRIPSLSVSVKLLPLLRGRLLVDKVVLNSPLFFLEKNLKSVPNWQFSPPPQSGKPVAQSSGQAQNYAALISRFFVEEVDVSDATIRYREGSTITIISNISLKAKADKESGKISAEMAYKHEEETVQAKLEVGNIQAFLAGKATLLKCNLDAGERHLVLKSMATLTGKKLAFADLDVTLDKLAAKGTIEANFAGNIPAIKAELSAGAIDLTPYMVAPAKPEVVKKETKPGKGGAVQPQERWSSAPMNLSGLKKVNAFIVLHTESIVVRSLRIEKATITAQLLEGVLRLYSKNMGLYNGGGQVDLTINTANPNINWNASLLLNHVDVGRFLSEVVAFKQLAGMADGKMAFSAQGKSVKDIVSALKGQGNLRLYDGVLKGVNFAMQPDQILSYFSTAQSHNGNGETPFGSASASFIIEKGIVTNNDMLVHTPFTDITGRGTIDLPQYVIHYRLTPVKSAKWIGKPLTMTLDGALNAPKVGVDVASLIPQNAAEREAISKKIKDLKKNKQVKEGVDKLRDMLEMVQ